MEWRLISSSPRCCAACDHHSDYSSERIRACCARRFQAISDRFRRFPNRNFRVSVPVDGVEIRVVSVPTSPTHAARPSEKSQPTAKLSHPSSAAPSPPRYNHGHEFCTAKHRRRRPRGPHPHDARVPPAGRKLPDIKTYAKLYATPTVTYGKVSIYQETRVCRLPIKPIL